MPGYVDIAPEPSGEFRLNKEHFEQINAAVGVLKRASFNVKDYGAVGDGVNDDTPWIQNTIDAADTANGSVIVLPSGVYKVTSLTLKPYVSLVGSSAQSENNTDGTIILGTAGYDILTLQPAAAHMGIQNIQFSGGRDQIVTNAAFVTNVRVDNCVFAGASGAGVHVASGAIERWWFTNCVASGGQYFFQKTNAAVSGANYIDKLHFLNVVAGGQLVNNYRVESPLATTATWTNCVFNTASQHAVHIDGGIRDWVFINPNFEGAGQSGKENRTTLTGTVTAGATSGTLATATGWATGDGMTIVGAGANGADFTIVSTALGGPGVTVSGSTVSWTGGTSTTVTAPKVTNAEFDEIHFANSVATPAQIQLFGGGMGGAGTGGHLRYSVNAEAASEITFYGTNISANYPVYDPSSTCRVFGGNIPHRHPDNYLTEVFASTTFPMDASTESPRTQIVSPLGKNVVVGLRDTVGNNTGTIGEFQVRQADANRTAILRLLTGGDVLTRRYHAGWGASGGLAAGNITLSGGWGTTASKTVLSGANDQRGRFTVTSSGTGQSANPTITITFADGAWYQAPLAAIVRNGGSQLTVPFDWTSTTTTLVITWRGTPVAAETYTFEFIVMG
jgi:hypothetical protein